MPTKENPWGGRHIYRHPWRRCAWMDIVSISPPVFVSLRAYHEAFSNTYKRLCSGSWTYWICNRELPAWSHRDAYCLTHAGSHWSPANMWMGIYWVFIVWIPFRSWHKHYCVQLCHLFAQKFRFGPNYLVKIGHFNVFSDIFLYNGMNIKNYVNYSGPKWIFWAENMDHCAKNWLVCGFLKRNTNLPAKIV